MSRVIGASEKLVEELRGSRNGAYLIKRELIEEMVNTFGIHPRSFISETILPSGTM